RHARADMNFSTIFTKGTLMKSTTIFSRSLLLTALGLSASLSACGGDDTAGSGGSSSSSSSSSSGGGGGGGGTSASTPELKLLASFDATKSQLPEGLWVTADSKTAYVGYALTGEIVAVSLADNKVADFATVPAP